VIWQNVLITCHSYHAFWNIWEYMTVSSGENTMAQLSSLMFCTKSFEKWPPCENRTKKIKLKKKRPKFCFSFNFRIQLLATKNVLAFKELAFHGILYVLSLSYVLFFFWTSTLKIPPCHDGSHGQSGAQSRFNNQTGLTIPPLP